MLVCGLSRAGPTNVSMFGGGTGYGRIYPHRVCPAYGGVIVRPSVRKWPLPPEHDWAIRNHLPDWRGRHGRSVRARDRAHGSHQSFVILLPSTEALSFSRDRAPIALSRDGKEVAYTAWRGDTSQLYLRALDRLEPTPVPGSLIGRFIDSPLPNRCLVRVGSQEPLS